jgi:hypothetical protein
MWSSCLGFAVSTSCSLRLSYHPVRLRHAPIGLLKGPFNAFPDPSHFVLLPLESGQQFTDSFKREGAAAHAERQLKPPERQLPNPNPSPEPPRQAGWRYLCRLPQPPAFRLSGGRQANFSQSANVG